MNDNFVPSFHWISTESVLALTTRVSPGNPLRWPVSGSEPVSGMVRRVEIDVTPIDPPGGAYISRILPNRLEQPEHEILERKAYYYSPAMSLRLTSAPSSNKRTRGPSLKGKAADIFEVGV